MSPFQAWCLGQRKIGTWNPSSQLPALRAWIIFTMVEVDGSTSLYSQVEAMCYALHNDEKLNVST